MTEDNTKKVLSVPQPELPENERAENNTEKPAVVRFRVKSGLKAGPDSAAC